MCSGRLGETKSQANDACRPDVDGIFCLARFLVRQSNERWRIMNSNGNLQQSLAAPVVPPLFRGFPYLVTRIVAALHHIIPLPLSEEFDLPRLREIARIQARLNRLPTCLVLNSEAGFFIRPDGSEYASSDIPSAPFVEIEKLVASEPFPDTDELAVHQEMLRRFAQQLNSSHGSENNFVVGDPGKGGRSLEPGEEASLQGVQENGVPMGLSRCPTCGEFIGECIAPQSDLVVPVHCRCQNDNLCAGCLTPLHERKLNANFYSESDNCIWHVPGYVAFHHQCPQVIGACGAPSVA
jgi:hypothetical protein